jgi:hypothetical protein
MRARQAYRKPPEQQSAMLAIAQHRACAIIN